MVGREKGNREWNCFSSSAPSVIFFSSHPFTFSISFSRFSARFVALSHRAVPQVTAHNNISLQSRKHTIYTTRRVVYYSLNMENGRALLLFARLLKIFSLMNHVFFL